MLERNLEGKLSRAPSHKRDHVEGEGESTLRQSKSLSKIATMKGGYKKMEQFLASPMLGVASSEALLKSLCPKNVKRSPWNA